MIITRSGKISDILYMMGDAYIPMYLLKGKRPVTIDAGFACLGPIYEAEVKKNLQNTPPACLLFTHAHFDHCGSAAYFKKVFPEMDIACSTLAMETLARPKVLESIKSLSTAAREQLMDNFDYPIPDIAFEPFEVTRPLSEGDRIDLGAGLHVEAIHTPGHTRDCMSYWVPEEKILFVSEAAGIPDVTGYILCDHLIGYDIYMESLHRLAGFPADTLCLGHGVVFTGADAKNYFQKVVRQAKKFFFWVQELLEKEKGDIEAMVKIIRAVEYDRVPFPKQPEPAYLWNLRCRISAVQKKLQTGKGPCA